MTQVAECSHHIQYINSNVCLAQNPWNSLRVAVPASRDIPAIISSRYLYDRSLSQQFD